MPADRLAGAGPSQRMTGMAAWEVVWALVIAPGPPPPPPPPPPCWLATATLDTCQPRRRRAISA
eukprot:2336721-Pyramimonas_sp.AAC.1